ncbi:MAG: amidohydrolase family protein [Clostridiales bacterium]|jgi:predicted TIM-barrel fold metal-dependent hydrolase|nr:amidohydrolase family protein [Clostridiales bacterium]
MRLFRENRVVNWHEHVWLGPDGGLDRDRLRELVAIAKATHMDALVCSNPVMVPDSPPELARRCNDAVAEAAALHPGFIMGMGFVNPGFHDEAIAEVDRCILELGFAGVKLYNQYFISDPAVRGVIRRCAQLGAPILEHAGKLTHMPQSQPFLSDGAHFAKAASENPDATFIYAHIGGGGDWEWSLKAIAPHGNVFADTSGGGCDEGMIERAVELLGAGRLLFGTDMSFEAGVGKLLAADISWEDKKTILCNPRFEKYLERGPRHAD